MLKRTLLIIVLFIFSKLVFAQLQADIQMPKIVPPSPDAAALGKYGEIPVDKSTGVPEISIPLYEIKTSHFSLPITLSYHASGIKVEEIASWVGAGWSLNAGGLITRSIIGMADDCGLGFLNNSIKKASQIQWPSDHLYVAEVLDKMLDTDPDNFYFNFASHSGSFVFGDDKKPVITPYQPLKIDFNSSSKNFTIVDEQGNTYFFEQQEYVTSSISTYLSGISSWYLTKMVSADGSDIINFIYTTDSIPQTENSFNFSQDISSNGGSTLYSPQPMVKNVAWRQFNPVRISSILFNGGKVDFIAKNGRLDEANMSLDEIVISKSSLGTNQYDKLKSFKLIQDYFYSTYPVPSDFIASVTEADKHRLKLIGIEEKDATNLFGKTYQFEYNSGMLPQVHSFAQDKWGYFNGKVYNRTLLESQQIVTQPYPIVPPQVYTIGGNEGADRSISELDMKSGILEKIVYPTKGYTVFDYECNKLQKILYADGALNVTAIGALNQGGSQEISIQEYTPTIDMLNSGGNIFTVKLSSGNNPYGSSLTQYVKVVRVSDGETIYNSDYSGMANTQIYNLVLPLVAGVQYEITAEAHGTTGGQVTSQSPYAMIYTNYKVPTGVGLEDVGGLRIKTIKDYNNDGTISSTQTYKYGHEGIGTTESSGGDQLSPIPATYHAERAFGYAYLNSLGCCTGTNNIGGISSWPVETFSNTSIYPMTTQNGSPVAYSWVTIYHGDPIQNTGKSIYNYKVYKDSLQIISTGTWSTVKQVPVTWKNGEPIWEAHYRNNGGGQYSLVSETYSEYDLIPREGGIGTTIGYVTQPVGYAFPYPHTAPDGRLYTTVWAGGEPAPLFWGPSHFYWYDYVFSTGSRLLRQSTTNSYAPNGTIALVNTTNYTYDLNHLQPTAITTVSSKGESFKRQLKYPTDYPATEPYATMVSRNILTPVIEQSVYKGSNPVALQSTKTNYGFWDGAAWNSAPTNIIAPQTVEASRESTAYETRLRYHSYDDKGNVATVLKENDVKQSYLWGYNKTYPIANAVNAGANEIFFDPFEEGSGWSGTQWEYGATPINAFDNTKSHTGKSSARIDKTSNQLVVYCHSDKWTEIGTNSPRTYKYSGWVYSSGPTVYIYLFGKADNEWFYYTVVDAVGTTATNQWVYLEKEFTVPANVTRLNIRLDAWYAGGSVWFDDIKVQPSGAQMTTYTYDPLVGMTSQTDPNNRSTYYQYDGFGRLMLVRDNDKNILKKYCYTYAGQTENCMLFSSADMSGNYYSQNCSPQGQAYYVSVPAGMFSSTQSQQDANTQAQQYAQSQANQNGACQTNQIALWNYVYTGVSYTVYLYNTGTGQTYTFETSSYGQGIMGYIPAGTYDIYVYGNDYNWRSYYISWSYGTSGYGYAEFYNIPINASSNSIIIY